MSYRLRVVIAEDHYLSREGTRQLLESSGEIEVVAAVGDADAQLDQIDVLRLTQPWSTFACPPGHQTEGIDTARHIRR